MDGGLEGCTQAEACCDDKGGERKGLEMDTVATARVASRTTQGRKNGTRKYRELARRFVMWRQKDMLGLVTK